MEFIPRTHEEILSELWSWSQSPESQVEGTFTYDVFASNALEFAKVEQELAEAYRANFAQTTWGEYLDMRAAEHGVYRRAGNKAIGQVTVDGNGEVPAGSIFATTEGLRFVTTTAATVRSSATLDIEAQKIGAVYNVAADTITEIPLNIPGITDVTNPAATYDGYDEEDDDTLRERLLDKVRQPATSGNPHEYVQWAMTIVGVGAARCIRCPNGAGTVKVIIVDSNFEPANAELLERVDDYIQAQRPVGILNGDVEVVSASPVTINISADITGDIDSDAFKTGVQDYFARLIKKNLTNYQASTSGGLVSAAQIVRVILNAGADTADLDKVLLNGRNDDILLSPEELPTLGTITFT